ncbi:MAG TPA: hypothetical protein VHO46_15295 [Bacteroidales bacterium]|nr:hypothetical protein [Bacteroidales bacterium]
MKNKIRQLTVSGILLLSLPLFLNAQMGNANTSSARSEAKIEDSYTGNWKFEAPNAPEGSTEGDIVIKPEEVIMTFDNAVGFPSKWIKFRNDSIIYQTVFDGATVVFSVKIIDRNNMKGKAVWDDGETEFIMKKDLGVEL